MKSKPQLRALWALCEGKEPDVRQDTLDALMRQGIITRRAGVYRLEPEGARLLAKWCGHQDLNMSNWTVKKAEFDIARDSERVAWHRVTVAGKQLGKPSDLPHLFEQVKRHEIADKALKLARDAERAAAAGVCARLLALRGERQQDGSGLGP
jgi:hypothetical protein